MLLSCSEVLKLKYIFVIVLSSTECLLKKKKKREKRQKILVMGDDLGNNELQSYGSQIFPVLQIFFQAALVEPQ